MTWVLIVMTAARYGYNEAAIPGYTSEDKCAAAGQVWVERAKVLATSFPARFICIPGPS